VVITSPGDLRFDASGLLPAIAQDAENGQVLMLAYMNAEAVARTLETGLAHYYSRSRQRLWRKGEDSGHIQRVRTILYDCDEDALLLRVDQVVAACHTGNRSCFYRELPFSPQGGAVPADRRLEPAMAPSGLGILAEVYGVILDRKANRPAGSYVTSLFGGGVDRILKKIGEEATEVLTASKNADRTQVIYEMADLWFHTLVLLAHHEIRPEEIAQELRGRFGKRKPEYATGRDPTGSDAVG
jgi:phosphoribosyl-ATP pyrophosphohydrolase/phosphoribosyl-AMP cyclohydrolase